MGPADARALSGIATTLAGCGRVDDARAVADLIADQWCRDAALPALAAALVDHGRVDEALDLVAAADGTWSEGQVLAAVAGGLEATGRHAEAMDAVARIDRDRVGGANDALVQMGRAAAAQHRYDDAHDCRSRIRSSSMSADPERDSITSAVAVAQCADGDLDAALATAELLLADRSVSICLADLARTCPDPVALDRIRRRAEPLAPVFRLAPLVAVAAAYRHADRPEDVQATLRAALDPFQALRLSGGGKSAPWEYDRDRVATAAGDLALELDRAGLDDDTERVRVAVLTMSRLQNGLRVLSSGTPATDGATSRSGRWTPWKMTSTAARRCACSLAGHSRRRTATSSSGPRSASSSAAGSPRLGMGSPSPATGATWPSCCCRPRSP